MKNFCVACHTDSGIRRNTNQDSLMIKGITDGRQEIILAVLCDGMGGMEKGELASATVIRAFSDWFMDMYSAKNVPWSIEEIRMQWQQLFEDANRKLIEYGADTSIQLGTTATAILLFQEGEYLIGHIGDTRAYRVGDRLEQLTEDHSFVAREIKRGNMTPEEALKDSRRNVLLQCIGVNQNVEPQFVKGSIKEGEAVLLCSDGFRHVVSETEINERLQPEKLSGEDAIKQELIQLVELNKRRQETDNISVIYVKLR